MLFNGKGGFIGKARKLIVDKQDVFLAALNRVILIKPVFSSRLLDNVHA
jgi:hypothetical protein